MNDEYTFREFYIPARMMGGIERYVEHGIPPGDFLSAIISNNLSGAVSHADEENCRNIPAYVGYLYNNVPSGCWGSPENFERWLRVKREERMEAASE
jgi:hypothetical protein